ncbi:unnamed protein product [Calypogeia fissa]
MPTQHKHNLKGLERGARVLLELGQEWGARTGPAMEREHLVKGRGAGEAPVRGGNRSEWPSAEGSRFLHQMSMRRENVGPQKTKRGKGPAKDSIEGSSEDCWARSGTRDEGYNVERAWECEKGPKLRGKPHKTS